jgi:hypothetical protein
LIVGEAVFDRHVLALDIVLILRPWRNPRRGSYARFRIIKYAAQLSVPVETQGTNTYPKVAVGVSMLVLSIIHVEFHAPLKCRTPLQS